MNTPSTQIQDQVQSLEPEYEYEDTLFGSLPVAEREDIDSTTSNSQFLVITDVEFAQTRVSAAQKHLRDYGKLPDKGQFPYVEYDASLDTVVFHGQVFVSNSNRISEI